MMAGSGPTVDRIRLNGDRRNGEVGSDNPSTSDLDATIQNYERTV